MAKTYIWQPLISASRWYST